MAKRFRTIEVVEPAPDAAPPPGPAHLTTLTDAFLFAGNAHFIVSNPSNERYEFAVRTRATTGRTTHYVRVRSAGGRLPYRYVGIARPDGTITPAGKSEFLPGTKEFDVAQWAFRCIINRTPLPHGYAIQHNGKCGKCYRTIAGDLKAAFDRGLCESCWVKHVIATT